MKIVKVPGVNALGREGPAGAADLIVAALRKSQRDEGGGMRVEEIEIDNSDIEVSERNIYDGAKGVFAPLDSLRHQTGRDEERVVFLGGDHSISSPIVRAFNESVDDAFLIVFDAHADCMPAMKEATHEEWLRAVVEAGFNPENVVLIGARKVEGVEWEFLREKGIKVFSEVYDVEAIGDYVTEKANGKDVYVSVDVDVLEPSVAPGVSFPEPNGLTSRELFYLLRRIFMVKGIRALDVVEVDVVKDAGFDFRTVGVVAKIVELFCKNT